MSSKGDGKDPLDGSGESLASRSAKITQFVLEKGNQDLAYRHLVSRDALLDTLFLLYDECNNEHMRRNKNISQFLDKYQTPVQVLRQLQVNVSDFEIQKIIGKGHFGEVHLVQEKQSGNIYAMKILRKSLTLEQQSVAFYEEERDIMMKGSGSQWLTSLQYSFQDGRNLYLVMEFLPGGDMLSLLERNDNLLHEEVAQFYLAEMVLALHSLHTMGYVHRDIKPDNILIDRTGHIKLADFGSAAKLNENKQVTSKMPVGTPDYIAPEVLTTMNKGAGPHYGVGCDWWSLGIVAYEMLFGVTPFGDDKVLVTYANIMNFKERLSFPDDIKVSDAAISLIKGLLQDAKTRLSYKELYDHDFFKGIDWMNLPKLVPPYVPTVSSQDDTSHFDDFSLDASSKKSVEPFAPKKDFSGKNLPFVGFTYSSCLSYVTEMYSGINDTLNSLTSSGSFMRSSLTLPRNHGRSSSGNSKESQLKKQVVALEAMESSLKSEVGLLKSSIKRAQEQSQLHGEQRDTALVRGEELEAEVKSLRLLLDLERKNSYNTERRAVELLRAIEQKYKKREALLKETAMHLYPSLTKQEESSGPASDNLDSPISPDDIPEQELPIMRESQETKDLNEHIKRLSLLVENPQSDVSAGSNTSSLTNGSGNATVIDKLGSPTTEEMMQEKLKESEEKLRQADQEVDMLSSQLSTLISQQEEKLKHVQQEYSQQIANLKKVITRLESSSGINSDQVQEASVIVAQEVTARKCEETTDGRNKTMQALEAELENVRREKLALEEKIALQEQDFRNQLKSQETAVVEQLNLASEVFQERLSQLQIRTQEVDLALSQLESDHADINFDIPSIRASLSTENTLMSGNHLNLCPATESTSVSPEILQKMLNMEAVLHKIHETQVSENNQLWELKGKLWKCEKEVSNKKLDIQIMEREKKEMQATLSKSQEMQRNLFVRLAEVEKQHGQCCEKETELRDQLTRAHREASAKDEVWQGRIHLLNSEKQVLEERILTLKEERKVVKDLEEQHAQNEGQFQELYRENEHLREKIEKLEDDKQRLTVEGEMLKLDLKNQTKNCQQLEKSVKVLKEASGTLEGMTKDLENALENQEKELLRSRQGESELHREVEKFRRELKSSRDKINVGKKKREELDKAISEMKEKHGLEVQCHQDRVSALERELSLQNENSEKLTSEVGHLEKNIQAHMSFNRSLETKNASLEVEILRIKEEASSHITTIAQLKRNGIDLQETLEASDNQLQEALWRIEQIQNETERQKASFCQEQAKIEAQLQQHVKLIDLLQQRLKEQTEKKKKWTFGLRGGGGKENKGPTPSKAQVTEKKRDRGFRQYVDFKEAIPKMNVGSENTFVPTGPPERTSSLGSVDRVSLAGSTSSEDSLRFTTSSLHIFYEMSTPQAVICSVCGLHIPSGKFAFRCRGCDVICHHNCKEHAPRECPSFTMPHEGIQRKPAATTDLKKIGGWVKVPRNRNAGWESRFMRIVAGRQLWISDQEIAVDPPLTPPSGTVIWDLCPADAVITLKKTLNPGDLQGNTADLQNMVKITSWPDQQSTGTCKDQIILFGEYEEKWLWCQALELPLLNHLKRRRKLITLAELKSSMVLNLEKCPLQVTCCDHLTKQFLLLGSFHGLHLVDLHMPPQSSLRGCILPSTTTTISSSFEGQEGIVVHKVILARRLGIVLLVAGGEHQLLSVQATDLLEWAEQLGTGTVRKSVPFSPVCSLQGIQQMAVSQSTGISPVILAVCSYDVFYLLKWNVGSRQFVIKQEVRLSQPCVSLHISSEVVLFAADKVYVVDLKEPGTCVEEFLDSVNANALTLVLNNILKQRNSPVAIFTSSPDKGDKPLPRPVQEEYLILSRDMGVLVNCLGQQDHHNQLSWALQPNNFAYSGSVIFGLDSQKVEIIVPDIHRPNLRGSWAFLDLSQALFLGQSIEEDEPSLYIAAVNPSRNVVEVFRIRGQDLLSRNVVDSLVSEANTSIISTASDAFSFTSSIEDALDSANSSTC